MDFSKVDYDDVFNRAKDITVYDYAMSWIRTVIDEEKMTERQKFLEIEKIATQARNHLKSY